ncbi:MAG TPA: potassium transporter TrkG [Dermatophilaceae bacterium]|nr:potassium transporter TrkG [Dermatophilaceae bacterium]
MANQRIGRVLAHPARIVPLAFLAVIAAGTSLLMLPAAHRDGVADPMVAGFTTVSAVCVTGLTTVDTATYWTPLGQAIILGEIQIGGFGIMSAATLVGVLLGRRLGLSRSLIAQAETHALALGDVRTVLKRVAISMAAAEIVVALLLTMRFRAAYDDALSTALWHGVFHSVSAFNNAGFALYSNNLMGFVADAWIILPISAAIVAGGIGTPVFFELLKRWRRPSTWTAHTTITVVGYLLLFVVGAGVFMVLEWTNPATLGPLSVWDKGIAGVFGGVTPRTAGYNSIDYGLIRPETLVITLVLMFIGGGAAGTAGGIKVTTFFVLGYAILAEVRGENEISVSRRTISAATLRQALSVALLGVGVVSSGMMALLMLTDLPLDKVVFEVVSAFGTVGLSTGITPGLPVAAQLVLMVVMFVGRVGTVTAASSLALRRRTRRYHWPEERPIVG